MDSKTRAEIRGRANSEEAIFQIGKGGINDNLIKQIDDALRAREIVKLTVLETAPESTKEAAAALSEALGAEIIQTIGYKIVLYRKKPEVPVKKTAKKIKPKTAQRKNEAHGNRSRTGSGSDEGKRYGDRAGFKPANAGYGRRTADNRGSFGENNKKAYDNRSKSYGSREGSYDNRGKIGTGYRTADNRGSFGDNNKKAYENRGKTYGSREGSYDNRSKSFENKGRSYDNKSRPSENRTGSFTRKTDSDNKKSFGRYDNKKPSFVKIRANDPKAKTGRYKKTDR